MGRSLSSKLACSSVNCIKFSNTNAQLLSGVNCYDGWHDAGTQHGTDADSSTQTAAIMPIRQKPRHIPTECLEPVHRY